MESEALEKNGQTKNKMKLERKKVMKTITTFRLHGMLGDIHGDVRRCLSDILELLNGIGVVTGRTLYKLLHLIFFVMLLMFSITGPYTF
jgi:hypothetical protein